MATQMIDGPRPCTQEELPEVIALVDSAMRQGSDQSLLTDYPLVYLGENLPHIRILKVDGELASVVPFIPWPIVIDGCEFKMGIISPTATAVHHQRKGYGLRCVQDCVRVMEQAGCELAVLWTRPATFPFYEHAGFQGVRSQGWVYTLTQTDANHLADYGEGIADYHPGSTAELADVQRLHPPGLSAMQRTPARLAALLRLPKVKTLLAFRGGRMVGYLVVSRAVNKPGLLEAGGDEAAIETLVKRALNQLPENISIDAYAGLTHSAFGTLLDTNFSARRTPMKTGQMMRINSVPGFFTQIAEMLVARNRGEARSFSLGVENEIVSFEFSTNGLKVGRRKTEAHIEFSRRDLAAVAFGAEPSQPVAIPEILHPYFPLYFPISVLDRS